MKSSFDNQESPAKRAPTPEEMKEIAATLRECRFPMYAERVESAADALAEREWRHPTEAMKLAGARSIGKSMSEPNHTVRAELCWQAMVAALPSPPPAKEGEKT